MRTRVLLGIAVPTVPTDESALLRHWSCPVPEATDRAPSCVVPFQNDTIRVEVPGKAASQK
jgi:hypothetical protein